MGTQEPPVLPDGPLLNLAGQGIHQLSQMGGVVGAHGDGPHPRKVISGSEGRLYGGESTAIPQEGTQHRYMLPTETNPMLGPDSFGHTGRGGSLAFAGPEHGIAFGYVTNQIVAGSDDVRAASLVDVVRGVVARD